MEINGSKIILCEYCNDPDSPEEHQLIDIHCFARCAKDIDIQEIADHIESLLGMLMHRIGKDNGHN